MSKTKKLIASALAIAGARGRPVDEHRPQRLGASVRLACGTTAAAAAQ